MQISVLIPTHNRPQLFNRCIESVFAAHDACPVDLEIIVNNDSADIIEVFHSDIPVTYHYLQHSNLSKVYKLLFDCATKEYIYYLEDDDVMSISFFAELSKLSADIYYFNYVPYRVTPSFLKFFDYTKEHESSTKEEFFAGYDDHHFQFCQICFKKSALPEGKFPTTNCLQNDYVIFKELQGSFKAVNKFLYKQTVDGHDNISFAQYNKDPRWNSQ